MSKSYDNSSKLPFYDSSYISEKLWNTVDDIKNMILIDFRIINSSLKTTKTNCFWLALSLIWSWLKMYMHYIAVNFDLYTWLFCKVPRSTNHMVRIIYVHTRTYKKIIRKIVISEIWCHFLQHVSYMLQH